MYYASGIGLVKTIGYTNDGNIQFILDLEKYEIK
jgi:hypothetical protein